MCADNCEACQVLDQLTVRQVTWCPNCGQREVGEGLTRCVLCEAVRPNP